MPQIFHLLNSYGWIDQQNGVIRIPIKQAKELIEQRGLPASPPSAAGRGMDLDSHFGHSE
jgi:hypothetical protein